jgi:hypothetical protein
MATDKYQLNAFLAFLLALVGFVACIFIGALTRFVLPEKASLLVAISLMVSLLVLGKSKVQIRPGSQKSLRLAGIVIGMAVILFVIAAMLYNYDSFQ